MASGKWQVVSESVGETLVVSRLTFDDRIRKSVRKERFDKVKASLSKGGGTAQGAVTEDSLHRAVLNHRGMFGRIGANKSSVTPHSGATAPLLKEPFLRQHR